MHHHAQLIFVSSVETGFLYVGQADLELLSPSDLPALASQSVRITADERTCQCPSSDHAVEMGFHHVGQAGFEFLTSSDPPTSASQSAKVTDVSHCAWPNLKTF
ncbi:hypothetical protein AAY473_020645, partial [Plecturocebus cupreus]